MQRKTLTITDVLGNAIRNASVRIVLAGTTTPATIFADNSSGVPTANPLTTDGRGRCFFYAANGRYDAIVMRGATLIETRVDIQAFDDADVLDGISVESRGAVGDGATSSNEAFEGSYSDVAENGTIKVGPGKFVIGSIAGTKPVLWDCAGSMNSAGTTPLDLPGIVETMFGRRKLIRQSQSTATDYAAVQVQRISSHAGGTPGFVNVGLRSDIQVGPNVTNFEWALLGAVDNSASAGENTGVYGQGFQRSTGATWGGTFEARDLRNQANTTGALVGCEVDVFANGTDSNNTRVGLDVAVGKGTSTGAQCEAAFGIRVAAVNYSAAQGRVKVGVSVALDADVGFDTSAATFSTGGVAFRMANDQKFSLTTNNDRTLSYTSSGFQYQVAGTGVWTATDAGGTNQAGAVQVAGITAVTATGLLKLRPYTVATLPAAGGANAQCLIFVSDGAGNKRMAVSDGTAWRWPDGAIVS